MNPNDTNVLIVDDDPAMAALVKAQLNAHGYEVATAANGREALDEIERGTPSFLITDWDLPEMDGLELCRQVRQLNMPGYIYIVFLTGRAGQDDLVAAMEAGADDFLSKPMRKHELLARMSAGSRILGLESQLSELADNDSLTGLLQRRAFDQIAEREWQRALRCRLRMSAVMLDIDHFKRVNDTYGHPVGDDVLRCVARHLREQTRSTDIVCRFGGEEFCVLLLDSDEASAIAWADRVRESIAATQISAGPNTIRVTVSFGVTESIAEMADKDRLLEMADQCLLVAKRQGGNRVVGMRSMHDRKVEVPQEGHRPGALEGTLAIDAMIPLVHYLSNDWPIVRAASYFLQYRVSSAPVTGDDGSLIGIVTEKDVLAMARSADAPRLKLADVVRTNVITFDDSVLLSRVLSFLTRASISSVILTSDDKPCGLVTQASILRWFLDNAWASPASATEEPENDGSFALQTLSSELVAEAQRLHVHLRTRSDSSDAAPIIGGASRLQQLIDDLLAGSACGRPVGGGLPF